VTPPSKRRLLVFNQYYAPGVEATARLLTALCEGLAEEYEVTVVTGRLRDHEAELDFELRNGVEVIRVHSTSFDRAALHKRAANYFTYLGRALRRGLLARRPDVVLCMTDPPMIGDVALLVARRFRAPLVVVSQDVFPEIAVALGRLTNPAVVRLLDSLIKVYLRRADRVVSIGETMERRLASKGVEPRRITVIPNWADTEAVTPRPRDNPWSREQLVTDRFVVMHSGNVGYAQNLETLIAATTRLEELNRLAVLILGFGARHAHNRALAERARARHVRFLPYQPDERLSDALSSADVHYVGLSRGLAGFVVPSRVYGILAVGRPILAAVDAQSETAALVRSVDCGIVVPPDDPERVAHAIRELEAGVHDLDAMGRRGREYVESQASRTVSIERYRRLLADTLAERGNRRR
jgi:glycosyltransferase involved in cell wall biosynthesis